MHYFSVLPQILLEAVYSLCGPTTAGLWGPKHGT